MFDNHVLHWRYRQAFLEGRKAFPHGSDHIGVGHRTPRECAHAFAAIRVPLWRPKLGFAFP